MSGFIMWDILSKYSNISFFTEQNTRNLWSHKLPRKILDVVDYVVFQTFYANSETKRVLYPHNSQVFKRKKIVHDGFVDNITQL